MKGSDKNKRRSDARRNQPQRRALHSDIDLGDPGAGRASTVVKVRVNAFKLYYFRRLKKYSLQRLAKAVKVPKHAIMVLEAGARPGGGTPRDSADFTLAERSLVKRIEAVLKVPESIVAGDNDFQSLFINYYSQSRPKRSAEYQNPEPAPQPSLFFTKAVVFDFDGTLTKRKSQHRTTWEHIWNLLGDTNGECGKLEHRFTMKEITHDKWCDMTMRHFRGRGLTEIQVKSVGRATELVEGIEHTLRFLRAKGVKCFLLSGSIWQIIQEALGDEIGALFEDIQCNLFGFDKHGVINRIAGTKYDFSSKGEYINNLKKEYGLKDEEILFVGNSYNDSFVKKVSGVKTLLVNPEGTHPGSGEAWDSYEPAWNSASDVLRHIRLADNAVANEDVFTQAIGLLESSETYSTAKFEVIGKYLRYQKDQRESLIALADRISGSCLEKRGTWQNYLLCASPGSGKTFFVQQLSQKLKGHGVRFFEIDISRDDETTVRETLNQVEASNDAVLCMIDEIDGRQKEDWVYDAIYKALDLNKSSARKPTVFVLIGSGDGQVENLLARIHPRLKGADLLDRIPDSDDFRFSLPPPVLGDRLIGFLSSIVSINPNIKRVENFALYYMLGTYGNKTPRQVAGLAERSAQCVGPGETVLRFDHVISAGSGGKEAFSKIHELVQQKMSRHLLTLC